MNKKKGFFGKIKKILFVALIAYGVFLTVKQQVDVMIKRQELAEIEKQCQEQILLNEQLSNTLANENEEDYVERIAREQFGYVYPDERIYIDISGS